MIRTNDAVAAMLFMVHARRLGLDPVAVEDGRGWALETRNAEMGESLWELLADDPTQPFDHLDLQFVADARRRHAALAERHANRTRV